MGVLGSIIQSLMLSVFHTLQDFLFSSPIAFQLIGDDHSGGKACWFQQFAKELLGSRCVASALHQDIEYCAVLVNGPPQVELLALNFDDHFIQMPFITSLWPLFTNLMA